MGWGRYLLLGDIGQQLDLSDQKDEIARLREEIRRRCSSDSGSTDLLKKVQEENDELRLYLTAIIRILISKSIVTESEMKQIVDVIDGEDGKVDGKITSGRR